MHTDIYPKLQMRRLRHYARVRILLAISLLVAAISCSPRTAPYENGPVMSQKSIEETFSPILVFMDYKAGMAIADVGAGSGALTVMMSTLMTNSDVYIQDIDTAVLNDRNLDRIIDYYSKQNDQDLRARNDVHLVIGTTTQTLLPDGTLDLIYSNATVHNFTEFDLMLTDLGRKLKPEGVLFLRDSFEGDHGEGPNCSDPKCGRPLMTIDEFLAAMTKNGFTLVKKNPDLSGYPVFGFKVNR
jgi:ubiquinone/menaquinone biosynthesis C-methylase UbiE